MNDEMTVAALMWALDQDTRERRTLINGYKARRVTLFDPWARSSDTAIDPHYGVSASAWVIQQYGKVVQ